jgi:DNA invertase Pin-like site-specific DNA recombinase
MSIALHASDRQNASVGLTNDELTRRYKAGEPLAALAEAAEMTRSGLYERLRRLKLPPRRQPTERPLTQAQLRRALNTHGSVNAAAAALGVSRENFTADAQRYGLLDPPPERPADLAQQYNQLGSLEATAAHYKVSVSTIRRWLRSLGVERKRSGRQARDT